MGGVRLIIRIIATLGCLFLVGVFIYFIISGPSRAVEKMEGPITSALEAAYFEGQRDALEGDIRIQKDSCGDYKWVKSPWDDEFGDVRVYPKTNGRR